MRWPIPLHLTRSVVRRLRRRGDAARDAHQWLVAAALYEEALALGGPNPRLQVQVGHMFKEAGEYDRAEAHYAAAALALADDADLQLQLGHFHKTADRPDRAETAYARALALKPGWAEAERELRALAGLTVADRDGVDSPILPELLPAARPPEIDRRERIVVHRLGAELAPGPGGVRRVLRGVQAIRGWCRSTEPLATLALVVNGQELRRERLAPTADDPAKYVFNLWQDFSTLPPGEARVELHFRAVGGRVRIHRATVLVMAPLDPSARPASDALVAGPGDGPAEAYVDALPSVVRPAARALFPPPRAILVQRIDQLGDLACSVPAIRRLREHFPAARLVGLLSPANVDLARALALFDAVVVADFPERHGRRGMDGEAQRRLGRALADHRFDLAIDLSEVDDSRPLLLLSGAPFLFGFGTRRFPWLSGGMELAAPDPLDRLESAAHGRKLTALVDALAAIASTDAVILPRTDSGDAAVLHRHGMAGDARYAVLHTGARLACSRWPGFPALAGLLLARTDLDIMVMVDDPAAPPPGLPRDPRITLIGGRLPFDEFDALLAGAAVFVGNDSGPKHLAALRGTKVVSLHMARLNWNEWGQEQTGAIISRRVPCAGCGIAADPDECGRDFVCIRGIAPEEVLEAVLDQLGR